MNRSEVSRRGFAIVVHYNSPDTAQATIGQLLGADLQVLLVDNSDSFDAPPRDGLTVLNPGRNLGYAAAINEAVRYGIDAFDEPLWFLVATHEVQFQSNSLDILMSANRLFPKSLVAPVLVTATNGTEMAVWSAGGSFTNPFRYPKHQTHVPSSGVIEARWVDGACFILPIAIWKSIDGLPEDFFLYMEDVALGLMLRREGYSLKVITEAQVMQHANGPSQYLAIRNRWILADRYMAPWERYIVKASLIAQSRLNLLPGIRRAEKALEARAALREAKQSLRKQVRR